VSHGLAAVPRPLPQFEENFNGAPIPPQNVLERPLAIVRRYKWLMLGIVIAFALGGFAASRRIKAHYEARATIWVAAETPELRATGPIRSGELLHAGSWIELLRSYRILDEVVRKLSLYLQPVNPKHRPYFAGFDLSDKFVAGVYEIDIDRANRSWSLQVKDDKAPKGLITAEKGSAVDSVGRKFGFKWVLPETAFSGAGVENVTFNVSTPRETSIVLADRLSNHMSTGSNFLWLTYTDADPQRAAAILNTCAERLVRSRR